MPNKAGIDFTNNTYNGKNADNVYHGYRGLSMNPNVTQSDRNHGAAVRDSFQDASRNTYAGYNGVSLNPTAGSAAQRNAEYMMREMKGNQHGW